METLNRVLAKELRVKGAARLLGVSERHTWQLLAANRSKTPSALVRRVTRSHWQVHALSQSTTFCPREPTPQVQAGNSLAH